MINLLGKSLVLLHLVISVVALTCAAALFLNFTDWGWKEAKQNLDVRIASEFDKSSAALKQAVAARDMAFGRLPDGTIKRLRDSLAEAEASFPKNHIYYVNTVRDVKESTEPIEARELKIGGVPPETPLATPAFDNKVDGLTKSRKAYEEDLKKVSKEIEGVEDEIRKVLVETRTISFHLTGKDDKGGPASFGIYDLSDAEFQSLTEARREKEEIKPYWAHVLEEARLYRLRRNVLERTLDRLKKARAAN